MKYFFKTMIISIIVNLFLVVLQLAYGFIANSKALIADAINSLSDLTTDVIAIIGQKLSRPEPDKKHPYGHGKMEYITSLIIGLIILLLGLGLIFDSTSSASSVPSNVGIIAIVITIIVKSFLSKHVVKQGKIHKNSILLASGKENFADVLSSFGVLFTTIASNFVKYVPIFKYADAIGGIIISLFIIKTAYNILKENINCILGENETDEKYLDKVRKIINTVDGVSKIDELVLEKYGSYYSAIITISINKNYHLDKAHKIADLVELKLLKSKYKINYITIHTNPY
ncbi:MAG: cation diffusion facilitator family transporter [Bacilli bacterium]|nr:cation diffusion facilitator family transporter [Bacilli bacterium]